MRGRLLLLLALAILAVVCPAAAGAQRARAEVAVPPRERLLAEGPQVRATGVLADAQLLDLMRNGFPTRLTFRLELWSDDGIINDLRGTRTWEILVRYDALEREYVVYRLMDDRGGIVARARDFAAAREAAERWQSAPLVPRRPGQYYYTLALDVESLSLGDLDELERWLRGELQPAIARPRRAGNAITRGLRTLVARLLGGESARYAAQSGKFRI